MLDNRSSLPELRSRAWVRLEDLWLCVAIATKVKNEKERAQRLKAEKAKLEKSDPILAAEEELREKEERREQGENCVAKAMLLHAA